MSRALWRKSRFSWRELATTTVAVLESELAEKVLVALLKVSAVPQRTLEPTPAVAPPGIDLDGIYMSELSQEDFRHPTFR